MKKNAGVARWMFVWIFVGLVVEANGAVTLTDAHRLWRFDHASSGTASAGQIVDANGNPVNAASSNLSWVPVPATGPSGGDAVGTLARGLSFNPSVTVVPGAGDSGGTNPLNDTAVAATFQVSTGATVKGNATIITRLYWNGPIASDDNFGNVWLVNSGMGGSNVGFMMGFTLTGRLTYYTASVGGSGATHVYNSGPGLVIAEEGWYDIAMVVDNLGTTGDATGKVTFYAKPAAGNLITDTSGNNVWVNENSGSGLTVGAEQGGTGSGNQRKTFDGTLDYLALFDEALSEAEVLAIFAVPEPSRGILVMMAGMLLIGRRRKA
ncbi:PEP-CTERM sorting domain-containing protein [Phragmitibacter flavus]|uniref:PEP-CTERM sorting domain-containing protein n=1 Tax=Phragmitibacter flavus TaxID=2576071 RepID=A0A5R8KD81_9BACT|nr:PEP-CTERM sorting domain-containing protein [Phragmitibacter flavus]TLD70274.1 PEP-CTERM sorting domain-containing protein [Phragmitibacter flavus]